MNMLLTKGVRRLSLQEIIDDATPGDIPDILKQLSQVKSETEKSLYIQKLSAKFKLPKQAIQRDLKAFTKSTKTEDIETQITAYFPGLVDLVNADGEVAFLIKEDGCLQVTSIWEIDERLYSPPERQYLPFELPRAREVEEWYQMDNDKRLFEDLMVYLKRFSFLPDNLWVLVACKVFLSYIQDHPDIHYMPMLLFWAVPERGKSRTGKAIIYVVFRGVHLVDLREANLFRYSEDLKATLFLDIMDLWKKAERNRAEDILLLRYEKGARAARVLYPERGSFKDMVHYDIYGPTIIATNEPVHFMLDTRCIPITMPNKPADYENPTPEKAQELKERLTAWRARVMDKPLPEIETIQGLNSRIWDISKPLLQVCKLVYPEGLETLKDALLEIAGQRLEDKKASIEGQIVSIIAELSPEGLHEWEIETQEILAKLNSERPEGRKLTSQWLGKKLTAMGLSKRKSHGVSVRTVDSNTLEALKIQYGLTPKTNSPLSPLSPNQGISTVYTGDSAGECQGTLPNSPPPETLENKGTGECGEYGDSYQSVNMPKTFDNTEFDSFLGGVCQTEKQDKCALCDRLEGCMLTKGQRQLCGGPFNESRKSNK